MGVDSNHYLQYEALHAFSFALKAHVAMRDHLDLLS